MFTPQLLHAYKHSGSKLPLSTWIGAVAKNLPRFKDDSDIYMPIRMQIKVAGDLNASNGNVTVSVSPFDANWYESLVKSIEEMTGKKNLKIVDYLGEPVEKMGTAQLMNVGECDIVDKSTNATVRLKEAVPPPKHLATNKISQLKDWWAENQTELSAKIASSLQSLSLEEVAKAVSPDGSVQNIIESYLSTHTLHDMHWDEFVRTYGKEIDVSVISKKILDSVRNSLVANEIQIRNFRATENLNSEASLWKRNTVTTKYKDGFTLYRDIVEDAVCHPMINQQVVQTIQCGDLIEARGGGRRKAPPPRRRRNTRELHPISSYYKLHHYPVHGSLPGHVVEQYNRTQGKSDTDYPGDHQRAIDMFNLFSGRSMIGCKTRSEKKSKKMSWRRRSESDDEINEPIPTERDLLEEPIGCKTKAKKTNWRRSESDDDLLEEPIGRALPKLVPIERDAPIGRALPKLVPIERDEPIGRALPKLVPIERDEPIGRALPKLVPIERDEPIGRALPKLVPIERDAPIGRVLPKLVPIERDAPIGRSMTWVDDEPNLADFL